MHKPLRAEGLCVRHEHQPERTGRILNVLEIPQKLLVDGICLYIPPF